MSYFLRFIDFNATPRIQILKVLAQYATVPKEKAMLNDWCGENKDDFLHKKYSLFEVLEMFPSVKPPIAHFLEFAPKIVRSCCVSPQHVRLLSFESLFCKPCVADPAFLHDFIFECSVPDKVFPFSATSINLSGTPPRRLLWIRIAVTVAKFKSPKPNDREFTGICSSYLVLVSLH